MMEATQAPCAGCPYRVGVPATWRPHAIRSVKAGKVFGCRDSAAVGLVCAGWLATDGATHREVADAAGLGMLDGQLEPQSGWPELHDGIAAADRPAQTVDPIMAALRRRREGLPIAESEMAALIGVSMERLRRAERGTGSLTLTEVHAYAAAVGWELTLQWPAG